MSDDLNERIELLETRLAFQDEAVRQLDEVVRELFDRLERAERDLAHVREQLERPPEEPGGIEDEVPPHY